MLFVGVRKRENIEVPSGSSTFSVEATFELLVVGVRRRENIEVPSGSSTCSVEAIF